MPGETIEELTVQYEEDGVVKVEELAKEVLTKGSWTTIVYRYREMDRKSGEYGEDKVRIQRYRKRDGVFYEQSKFNITNGKQARQLVDILSGWFPEGE